jgi:hypothetical protein
VVSQRLSVANSDLGTGVAKWGTAPWPSELGQVTKVMGSKAISDAVASINAPRRTADYNGECESELSHSSLKSLAGNAFYRRMRMTDISRGRIASPSVK